MIANLKSAIDLVQMCQARATNPEGERVLRSVKHKLINETIGLRVERFTKELENREEQAMLQEIKERVARW